MITGDNHKNTELHELSPAWLASTTGGIRSRAFEEYFATIDRHLHAGRWREALELSLALPEICSALEHPMMRTSSAHCACWCDSWLAPDWRDPPLIFATGSSWEDMLRRARSMRDQPQAGVAFSRALLQAARTWYRRRGSYDVTVQQNLARLEPV